MKILLVEDERDIREFVKSGLEAESFVVDAVSDGSTGLDRVLLYPYDAILLDMNLPGGVSGIDIATRVRQEKKDVPIIVLTVESEIDFKVKILELCDDYITKPFSLKEVVARLHTVLRRGAIVQSDVLEVGDLKMDIKRYQVTRAGTEVELRNKEFSLLEYFMRNPGIVLSRGTILEHVWDMNADPFTNTVDVHVRLLRKKIDDSFDKKLIKTVSGRGYKIDV